MAHGATQPIGAGAPGDLWSVARSSVSSAWLVRPEVAAPLLIVAGAYAIGWWRLRRRGGAVSGWRVAASVGGWLSVLVALSAPLDRLAHASFAAHMVQHLLLIVGAAPLLLLADPFAALCWALPAPIRAPAPVAPGRGPQGRKWIRRYFLEAAPPLHQAIPDAGGPRGRLPAPARTVRRLPGRPPSRPGRAPP